LVVPVTSAVQDDRAETEREAMSRFIATRSDSDFSALFSMLYPSLYRYFCHRHQPHREAEELAQNVMIAIHRHAPELRDLTLFHGWVYRIARNELLMARRYAHAQRRSGTTTALKDATAVVNPENDFLHRSTLARLLQDVDETSREVLHLRVVDELSYQDIAEALDIPIGTVKWRLYQAKLKLARHARTRFGGGR
jgi:RNA polymerase sigma-70 factor, ECF subfamily